MDYNAIEAAADTIANSDALLIGAGAGMGVDSGLPDFRGNEGFWRAYPALAKLQIPFERMAAPEWFQNNPKLAWAFYGHRLNLYRRTVPHAGFAQLLEIGKRKKLGYFVYTSNVDGQFQKAGYDPRNIVECHGSIHHFQCTGSKLHPAWPADGEQVAIDEGKFEAREPLPKCPDCGRMARPNILMFNDWKFNSVRAYEQNDRFNRWLFLLSQARARIAIVECGAGTAIPSVRHQAERTLQILNGTIIRINPREHQVAPGHVGLASGAAEAIAAIVQRLGIA